MTIRGKSLALVRVVTVSALLVSVIFMLSSGKAVAAGNPEISFQGKVVSSAGVNVPDGSYNMEFKIYTGCTNEPASSTGCTTVWTEDYLVGGGSPNPVSFTSGTFQVNLGSACTFAGGTCQGNTNTAFSWDQTPLYLSMQIGNTSTCSTNPPAAAFTADCGGDGVMNPFIEMTATPYAEDSALLGGLSASAFGQLSSSQSWINTNTFQPTTNVSSLVAAQNTTASPTADIFDVEGQLATDDFIQVTSTAINQGAVNIQAFGVTNALSLQSGGAINIGTAAVANTIQVGATNSAITDTIGIGNNTNASGISTITIGGLNSTSTTTVQGGTGVAGVNLKSGIGGGTTINGTTPAVASSGAGTSSATTLTVTGATGGADTAITNVAAGAGGAIALATGGGGAESGATGANTGGAGGALSIQGGTGGNLTSAGAGFGGAGGSFSFQAGNGGTAVVGSTNGAGGNITLSAGAAGAGAGTAAANGSVIVQNQANSDTAFQIQNTAGVAVFVQGTNLVSYTNLLTNYNFTGGTTGWAVAGAATTLTQVTAQANVFPYSVGLDSIDDTLAASGTSGIEVVAAGLSGGTLAAGTYNFGFYAKGSAGITGLSVAFNGTGGTCTTSTTTISGSGYTYYTCTAVTATATTIITIQSTASASQTLYISDPQVSTTALTNYQVSQYQTNGVNTAAQVDYQNTNNSTTAFQVQNAAGTTLFNVDTLNGNVIIGSNNTANTNVTLLQPDNVKTFTETATCTTSVNQGGIYYNAVSNTVRACVNGGWEDLVSTSGLGILLYGVVPDSSNAGAPGDLGGISGNTNSPCKVVIGASTTQLIVEACTAYSGGRKVIVPQTTINTTAGTLIVGYTNLCLTGAGDQPALLTGNATESSAAEPTFSPNNPVLCLATINATVAGTVSKIFDIRTYTNTQKAFTTTDTASGLGWVMAYSASNEVAPSAATPTAKVLGVSVTYSGTISTTAINMIIATAGPQWVKALTTVTTVGDYVEGGGGTTVGYVEGVAAAAAAAYEVMGINQTVYNAGTCTTNANCQASVFMNPMNIGY